MKKLKTYVLALLMAWPLSAVEIDNPNHVLLEVKGIVCSFCAHGMAKKLSKLDFLDRNQFEKGILTDIKKGFVTLAVTPDSEISIKEIYTRIKKGGYDLKAIHLKKELADKLKENPSLNIPINVIE